MSQAEAEWWLGLTKQAKRSRRRTMGESARQQRKRTRLAKVVMGRDTPA